MSINKIAYLNCGNINFVPSATGLMACRVTPLGYLYFFLVSIQLFPRNSLFISVQIPNLLLTAGMISLCFFIVLALLGLSLPANTALSPQLKEFGDNLALNDDIIPFDTNYYIATDPYIPTDPLLNAQIDGFSVESSFQLNSPSEPVILAQISDQGVIPNPDHGNAVDPDIEAGGICRKTKRLYCCKGRYNPKTQKVAQPCKLCTLYAFSSHNSCAFVLNQPFIQGSRKKPYFVTMHHYIAARTSM